MTSCFPGWLYLLGGPLLPVISKRARLITKLYCAYRPVSPSTSYFPFASHVFAGEAMLIEEDFPDRPEQSAMAREH